MEAPETKVRVRDSAHELLLGLDVSPDKNLIVITHAMDGAWAMSMILGDKKGRAIVSNWIEALQSWLDTGDVVRQRLTPTGPVELTDEEREVIVARHAPGCIECSWQDADRQQPGTRRLGLARDLADPAGEWEQGYWPQQERRTVLWLRRDRAKTQKSGGGMPAIDPPEGDE